MPCLLGDHLLRSEISDWPQYRMIVRTNEENESLCRCWFIRNVKLSHSPDYGAHEVYIEDGIDIDQMEDNGNEEKGIAATAGHDEESDRLRRAEKPTRHKINRLFGKLGSHGRS
jgi:hypothetical protein